MTNYKPNILRREHRKSQRADTCCLLLNLDGLLRVAREGGVLGLDGRLTLETGGWILLLGLTSGRFPILSSGRIVR